MTEEKFRQEIQIIVAKLALGGRLTMKQKRLFIRYRAQAIVRAGRK